MGEGMVEINIRNTSCPVGAYSLTRKPRYVLKRTTIWGCRQIMAQKVHTRQSIGTITIKDQHNVYNGEADCYIYSKNVSKDVVDSISFPLRRTWRRPIFSQDFFRNSCSSPEQFCKNFMGPENLATQCQGP